MKIEGNKQILIYYFFYFNKGKFIQFMKKVLWMTDYVSSRYLQQSETKKIVGQEKWIATKCTKDQASFKQSAIVYIWWYWNEVFNYGIHPWKQTIDSNTYYSHEDKFKTVTDKKRPELCKRPECVIFHQDNVIHISLVTRHNWFRTVVDWV